MRLLTIYVLALYIASIHSWSSSGPRMPRRRAFVEDVVVAAIAVSTTMVIRPAWAADDKNVSADDKDKGREKEEAARIRKEHQEAKREKEERRIAEETKKRLAVGRIGTI